MAQPQIFFSRNWQMIQKRFDFIVFNFWHFVVSYYKFVVFMIPVSYKFVVVIIPQILLFIRLNYNIFSWSKHSNHQLKYHYYIFKFKTKKMQICFKLYTTHQLIIYYYYFKGLNQDLFTSHYHSSRRNWLRNKLKFLYAHLYACIFNIYLFSLNLKNNFI